ncbi:MAG: PQQ-dependent sugar dehydrogenase [bacterium]|nr:PQQ-dependent sugar dehydrogenase [bacterium]
MALIAVHGLVGFACAADSASSARPQPEGDAAGPSPRAATELTGGGGDPQDVGGGSSDGIGDRGTVATGGAAGTPGQVSGAPETSSSPTSTAGDGPTDSDTASAGETAAAASLGEGTAGHGGGAATAGGGTPPSGTSTSDGADGAASAGSTADTGGPVAPRGPRFPEPLGVTLTRLAELPVPLAVAFRSQEPGSLYVALRHGEVVRLRGVSARVDSSAALRSDAGAVLDMSARVDTGGEMGLLGLAFSPAGDRLYTSSVNRQQVSELWEWPVAADGSIDAGGGRLVLSLEQPFWNHNGGDVTFGPDGYLYLGFGDGGGGGDPLRAGQDPHDWLGTILRINPRPGPAGEPYTIPAGNPFADGAAGAPEVWVWGARNPWRFSFDRASGDLWVSDVGQDLLEEINRLPAADGGGGRGANLGWSDYEGSAPFWSNTEPPGHVRPVVEYRHGADARCSVTGGYVYRGSRLPGLSGVYLYSDFCDGTLWGYSDTAGAHPIPLANGAPPKSVLSFGQGPDGEIYVLTGNALWRLEPIR